MSAWLLAMLHYFFFRLIDGKELTSAFALGQSQVSILSLLLVTAFRATIVAILGICFAQYLWYLLRRKCLQVSLIEDLFQIRSNIWGLFNHKLVRQAPIFFLVATMSWLVPLATINPPAALTIQSELVTAFTSFNAFTMNSTMAYEQAIAANASSLAYVDQAVVPASQSRRMMSYHRALYMYVRSSIPKSHSDLIGVRRVPWRV